MFYTIHTMTDGEACAVQRGGDGVLGLDALPFSPAEVFDIMRKTAPNVARKWPEEAFSFKYILKRRREKGERRKKKEPTVFCSLSAPEAR